MALTEAEIREGSAWVEGAVDGVGMVWGGMGDGGVSQLQIEGQTNNR